MSNGGVEKITNGKGRSVFIFDYATVTLEVIFTFEVILLPPLLVFVWLLLPGNCPTHYY